MAGIPWTPEEKADLLACQSWEDFIGKGWCRTYDSWEKARRMERCRGKLGPAPKPEVLTPGPEPVDRAALVEKWIDYQRAAKTITREQPHLDIRLDAAAPIGVAYLSDLHLGSPGVDMERLMRDVETIRITPGLYCVLGGDIVDGAVLSKMADVQRANADIDVQWEFAIHVLDLLRPSLLGFGQGNHENWLRKMVSIDQSQAWLRSLPGVRYIGESSRLRLHVGRELYLIWRKHKYTSSQNSPAFGLYKAARMLDPNCDVYVLEHHHDDTGAYWNHAGRRRIGVRAGTYKLDDAYSREHGYHPSYGVPVTIFWPDEHRILLVPELRDAVDWLAQWWSTTDETA